ncbi:MAG TPA: VOC family protein [Thermoplasmata archaeon]|nr:VOC family protein [Thermoplasmata archaeon]
MRRSGFSIHHVLLAAPPGSEGTARAFFVGVLGMREVAKPDRLARRGGIWLDLGMQQLHIGVDPKFRPAEKAHPAFEVEDLDALRARLERSGVPSWEDEPYPGRRRFYVRDPFGNRLEFLASVTARRRRPARPRSSPRAPHR